MGLRFCPNCSNTLTISRTEASAGYPQGVNRWECRVCPYEKIIEEPHKERIPMKQKEVESVFSDLDALRTAAKHAVKCENDQCNNREAYFSQAQIRSADEPMTTFYTCTLCRTTWREN